MNASTPAPDSGGDPRHDPTNVCPRCGREFLGGVCIVCSRRSRPLQHGDCDLNGDLVDEREELDERLRGAICATTSTLAEAQLVGVRRMMRVRG